MKGDPTSLDNMQDLAVPPPVPWWPPAIGWWIVFALLSIGALILLAVLWRRWRADAYRRAALLELENARTATDVAEVLKRTAMCVCPRSTVASLSGTRWLEWLSQTGNQVVPPNVAKSLTEGVFSAAGDKNLGELKQFARDWVKHHTVAD